MNINQIKYFVAVYDNASFSLAAKSQSVTVQAVSKSINDLEREVGAKLFVRANRSVEPTPVGSAFYEKAQAALEAWRGLEEFVGAANVEEGRASKPFSIGFVTPSFAGCERLAATIARLMETGAGIRVEVAVTGPEPAMTRLSDGDLDALLTIGPLDGADLDCVPVGKLPTGVSMARTHPLAGERAVTLEQLRAYPASESARFDDFNESILVMYRDRGLIGEARRIETAAQMVKLFTLDNGYAFTAVHPTMSGGLSPTVLRPIAGEGALDVPICLVVPKSRRTPQFEALKDYFLRAPGLLAETAKKA